MIRNGRRIIGGVLFWSLIGIGVTLISGPVPANACSCSSGTAGGGDYVPQRRDSANTSAQGPSLTKEQAFDIVSKHVKKLNPKLTIGEIEDAGGIYKVEILSNGKKILQRIGVDKATGLLLLID